MTMPQSLREQYADATQVGGKVAAQRAAEERKRVFIEGCADISKGLAELTLKLPEVLGGQIERIRGGDIEARWKGMETLSFKGEGSGNSRYFDKEKLETIPGFLALKEYCASPEVDMALEIVIREVYKDDQKYGFQVRVEPSKPFIETSFDTPDRYYGQTKNIYAPPPPPPPAPEPAVTAKPLPAASASPRKHFGASVLAGLRKILPPWGARKTAAQNPRSRLFSRHNF